MEKKKLKEAPYGRKPKRHFFLRFGAIILGLAIFLGAASFGLFALTTEKPITVANYGDYIASVLTIEEISAERTSLATQLEESEAGRAQLVIQKAALENNITEKDATITQKENEIAANNAAILLLQNDAIANAETIAALEADTALKLQEIALLNVDLNALYEDLETVNEQLSIANANILTLQNEILTKDSEIQSLNEYIAILEAATRSTVFLQGQTLGTYSTIGDTGPITVDTTDISLFPEGFKMTATVTYLGNNQYRFTGERDGLVTNQYFEGNFGNDPADPYGITWQFMSSIIGIIEGDVNGMGLGSYPGALFEFFVPANYGSSISLSDQYIQVTLRNNVVLYIPFNMEVTFEEAQQRLLTYNVEGEVFLTESLYEGSQVNFTQAPEKNGYICTGWSLTPDGTVLETLTVGAENLTVYAIYVQAITLTYNVAGDVVRSFMPDFVGEFYTVEEQWPVGAVIELYTLDVPGYTFLGFSLTPAGELLDNFITVTENLSIYAVYEPVEQYGYLAFMAEAIYFEEFDEPIIAGTVIDLTTQRLTTDCFVAGWSLEENGSIINSIEIIANEQLVLYPVFMEGVINLECFDIYNNFSPTFGGSFHIIETEIAEVASMGIVYRQLHPGVQINDIIVANANVANTLAIFQQYNADITFLGYSLSENGALIDINEPIYLNESMSFYAVYDRVQTVQNIILFGGTPIILGENNSTQEINVIFDYDTTTNTIQIGIYPTGWDSSSQTIELAAGFYAQDINLSNYSGLELHSLANAMLSEFNLGFSSSPYSNCGIISVTSAMATYGNALPIIIADVFKNFEQLNLNNYQYSGYALPLLQVNGTGLPISFVYQANENAVEVIGFDTNSDSAVDLSIQFAVSFTFNVF